MTSEAKRPEFTRSGFRKLARHINPGRLDEIGRFHLRKAVKSEQFLLLWMVDGLLFLVLPLATFLSSQF